MPDDRAAVPAHRPAPIRVPDQLQQAQLPDPPHMREVPAERDIAADAPTGGILHELKTERAHD